MWIVSKLPKHEGNYCNIPKKPLGDPKEDTNNHWHIANLKWYSTFSDSPSGLKSNKRGIIEEYRKNNEV